MTGGFPKNKFKLHSSVERKDPDEKDFENKARMFKNRIAKWRKQRRANK